MAFEYIVKIMILIVVAAVVMNIIIYFSDDIKLQVKKMFGSDEKTLETETVESISFSDSQIRNYIKSCWEKTYGVEYKKDAICYILKGDVSSVNALNIQNVDGVKVVDTDSFNNTIV